MIGRLDGITWRRIAPTTISTPSAASAAPFTLAFDCIGTCTLGTVGVSNSGRAWRWQGLGKRLHLKRPIRRDFGGQRVGPQLITVAAATPATTAAALAITLAGTGFAGAVVDLARRGGLATSLRGGLGPGRFGFGATGTTVVVTVATGTATIGFGRIGAACARFRRRVDSAAVSLVAGRPRFA